MSDPHCTHGRALTPNQRRNDLVRLARRAARTRTAVAVAIAAGELDGVFTGPAPTMSWQDFTRRYSAAG